MPKSNSTSKRATKSAPKSSKLNFLGNIIPLPVRATGPEHKYVITTVENSNLAHNTLTIVGGANLLTIAAGTAYNQRIGNCITLRKLSARLWLSNKSDRPNVMYRATLVAQPYLQQDVDSVTELFAPGTSPNRILGRYTPYGVRILHDHVINRDMNSTTIIPSSNTAKERSYYYDFDLTFNQTITFNATGNSDWQYGLYLIAYDAYGTLTSDNIASYASDVAIVYEDA